MNSGAILDLGGFAQTINSVTLTGGTIQNGSLTGAISSAGGTVNGIGGSTSLEATASATPTMMEGSNTYTGATTVDTGATLSGAAGTNVFSAASPTTVNGTLDLGGNGQTVGSLAGTGIVTNSGASGTATLTNQGASSRVRRGDSGRRDRRHRADAECSGQHPHSHRDEHLHRRDHDRRRRAGVVRGGEHRELERGRARDRRRFRYFADDRGRVDPEPGQHRRRPDRDRLPRRADFDPHRRVDDIRRRDRGRGRDQQRGRRRADAGADSDRHGNADRRQHLYRRDDDQRRHACSRGDRLDRLVERRRRQCDVRHLRADQRRARRSRLFQGRAA